MSVLKCGCYSLTLMALWGALPTIAQEIREIDTTLRSSHRALSESQAQVNSVSDRTRQLVDDYLNNERQADVIEAYSRQLSRMLRSQEDEATDLQRQLDSIDQTEQTMLPLLGVMVVTLSKFVDNDLPFLLDERLARVDKLKRLLDRADVSVAEKYRQIMEAYQVEVAYGRTLEAYRGVLLNDEQNLQVNYLRMGRLALYYQSLNGLDGALWLPEKKAWQALARTENEVLTQALLIARQHRAPELLSLPIPVTMTR